MKVRTLGLRIQELEAGPYIFLLADSVPIAYKDTRDDAPGPGVFRTDRRFSKAATQAQNKWLAKTRYAIVPHTEIVQMFESISRFGPEPPSVERRENPLGRRVTDREPVEAFLSHALESLPDRKGAA